VIARPVEPAHRFELDKYESRMAAYIGPENAKNRVFFDALRFAHELHEGQRRRSGAPYISHPCAVAEILACEMNFRDPELLAAALLHDVVEDVPSVTHDMLENRFGSNVAELVDGCTKLTRYSLDRATLKDRTHKKIFLSASRRLGVVIIKLADRLHNMRTLHYLPMRKRQRIAQETVEVYAPIATRLNLYPLKRELYQLALSYLYQRKSKKILNLTRGLLSEPTILDAESKLRDALAELPCGITLRPRIKGLGAYYQPAKRTLEPANAENQVDFTVVLETEDPLMCYRALGIVNQIFRPMPRSLRDFIANPKPNGYRSLHVRVHHEDYTLLVKIRTREMDDYANYGVLAHMSSHMTLAEEHWEEIRQVLRNLGEYGGAGPQRKALIQLAETEEIYAFTPMGEVHYFPRGSVVLDFAYKVHSELGDYCKGARVNGERVGPIHPLDDGDTVRIIKSSEPLDVDPDLEEVLRTPKARTAVNKRLNQKRLHYAIRMGREIMQQELRRHGISPDVMESGEATLALEVLNLRNADDLYRRIGQDLLSPEAFLYYFTTSVRKERNLLPIGDLDRAVHKFAQCCNPHPGQADVLAVLSERGVTFHLESCKDLRKRYGLPKKSLPLVEWETESGWKRPLRFVIQVDYASPDSLFTSLAGMPEGVRVESLTMQRDRRRRPGVRLAVVVNGFDQARRLFESLPPNHSRILRYAPEDAY
jgi:GTP pyrophosphokinase